MKIRIMSNYDIAKNLIHIINESAALAKKQLGSENLSGKALKIGKDVSDVFVKSSEKAGK